MKCPVCATIDLTMSERQGIEIDYCPQCRGVWLDRGELDKIIERAQPQATTSAYAPDRANNPIPNSYPPSQHDYRGEGDYPRYNQGRRERDDDDDYRERDKREYGDDYRKRKRRSFLDDIFDFG